MTLLEEIKEQEEIVRRLEKQIIDEKSSLLFLMETRRDCHHVFSAPVPGYEHEGGTCTQCGINEVHAACMKIGAKYRG